MAVSLFTTEPSC